MRYLLAGVLVVVAAGGGRADTGVIRFGMTTDEVKKVMGRPAVVYLICVTTGSSDSTEMAGSGFEYARADWLGGRRMIDIEFGTDKRVRARQEKYHPFAARPPWLDMLRDALAPKNSR